MSEWISVDEPPAIGKVVLGYKDEWIDEDFNTEGIRECFIYGDGTEWMSAKWNDCHDEWTTTQEAPTHWMPRPAPPEKADGA